MWPKRTDLLASGGARARGSRSGLQPASAFADVSHPVLVLNVAPSEAGRERLRDSVCVLSITSPCYVFPSVPAAAPPGARVCCALGPSPRARPPLRARAGPTDAAQGAGGA